MVLFTELSMIQANTETRGLSGLGVEKHGDFKENNFSLIKTTFIVLLCRKLIVDAFSLDTGVYRSYEGRTGRRVVRGVRHKLVSRTREVTLGL
jgi:hypothetical protein